MFKESLQICSKEAVSGSYVAAENRTAGLRFIAGEFFMSLAVEECDPK